MRLRCESSVPARGIGPLAVLLIGLLLLAGATASEPAELPRRAYLGVSFELTDSGGAGLLVSAVRPGSTAALAGLRPGDRLTSVGTIEDLTVLARRAGGDGLSALRVALSDVMAGSRIPLRWYRGGRVYRVAPPLGTLPEERVPGSRLRYDSIALDGIRQRLIVTVPDAGAAALVLYIAGIGCDSQDYWLDTDRPVKRLVDGWASRGFATARLEKRGVGDSEGADCAAQSFEIERLGYAAAVARLTALGWSDRIVLFGHGVGGVIAPLVGTDQVAGIIVYGAPAQSWDEHGTERPVADGGTPSMLADRKGAAGSGRSAAYHRQLASVDPQRAWSRVWQPVLAVHGDCDRTAVATDQQRIAGATGGKFLSLSGLDESFGRDAGGEPCVATPGTGLFGSGIVSATASWIQTLPLGEPIHAAMPGYRHGDGVTVESGDASSDGIEP
jgi:hypothetical protein